MSSLFTPGRKVIVGMVHLLPLPGSPRFRGSMREIIRRARSDLRALLKGGWMLFSSRILGMLLIP
jgi:predicted TIM-barrel enzyme